MDWIHLAQERDQWLARASTAGGHMKCQEFIDCLGGYQLSERTQLHEFSHFSFVFFLLICLFFRNFLRGFSDRHQQMEGKNLSCLTSGNSAFCPLNVYLTRAVVALNSSFAKSVWRWYINAVIVSGNCPSSCFLI
jgi:hypothetical protein